MSEGTAKEKKIKHENHNTDYVRNIIEGRGDQSITDIEKTNEIREEQEEFHDYDRSESEFGGRKNVI